MQKYKSEISYNCFFISYKPKLVTYISAIGVNYSFIIHYYAKPF